LAGGEAERRWTEVDGASMLQSEGGGGKAVHGDQRLTRSELRWSARAGVVGVNDTATTELGHLRGRRARWRRFKPSPLDSFDGEVAGGGAELPGYSEGLGEAWNGEAARRPELGFGDLAGKKEERETVRC
jgi:hypothetical protein